MLDGANFDAVDESCATLDWPEAKELDEDDGQAGQVYLQLFDLCHLCDFFNLLDPQQQATVLYTGNADPLLAVVLPMEEPCQLFSIPSRF